MGSWKIIEMSRPRSARISLSGNVNRSRPSNMIRPPATRPAGFASRRMTARADTDLPQPDSPTSAMVSPGRTDQLTPSTALTTPRPVENSTRRSSTEMSGSAMAAAVADVGSRTMALGIPGSALVRQNIRYKLHDRFGSPTP